MRTAVTANALSPAGTLLWLGLALAAGGCGAPPEAPAPRGPAPAPDARPAPAVHVLPLVEGPGPLRPLARDNVDAYEIDLPAGSYLHAIFDQKGVDLVVEVFAPGPRRLYRIDSPNEADGPEELHLVAETTGRHRFEVSTPAGPVAGTPGAYRPTLRAVRAATARDREQAAADRVFYEAREIDRQPGRAWEAAAKYEEAIRRFEVAGDRWHRAYSFFRLARLHHGEGRNAEARELFARAEELFLRLGDTRFVTVSRNEIGVCAMDMADFAGASAALRSALDLARRIGAEKEQATILHNLGKLLQTHGHPWESLAAFREAQELWERQPGLRARANEADTLTGIGWVYGSLGQWRRAIDAHRRALLIRNRLGDPQKRAISLTQLGTAWLQVDPRRALPYMERAWTLQKEGESPGDQASTLNGLGLTLRLLGRFAEAQAAYRKALDLYSELHDAGGQSITWANLGWTSVFMERPDKALESFERGLRLARETHNPMAESRALLGMAVAERRRGNPTAAQVRAEASLAIVETLRSAAARPDLQTTWLADNEDAYGVLIGILMERHRQQPGGGYDLQALARSEQERARVLLDSLRDSRELRSDRAAGIAPALLARRRGLLAEASALDVERHRLDATPVEAAGAEVKLAERLDRLAEVDAEIRRQRLGTPLPARPTPTFPEQRRRLLDGDTLLLEFSLGSPHSYLWLLSADAMQSFELPDRDTLEPLLRTARAQLAGVPPSASAPPGEDPLQVLSRSLLAPVARQIRGKRLLIAADGAQQAIPFAALPDPEDRTSPLLLRHEIVSIPSLAVLGELRDREAGRRPAPLPLAVLADPVFDSSDGRLEKTALGAPRPDLQDLFLPRLRGTREEADAIAALLPAGRVLKVIDFAASRELVTSGRLSRYRTLHIATHGLLRQDHPELSALVLSRFARDGSPRDGYLRVPDIAGLALPADLVVLSACDTALGRATPGEGMEGLPQAFFTAGATRVLVSLWPVEEESTAALMKTFYRRLLIDRLPAGRALREAQLAIRAEPRWSAPRYWAGFVLQGDWR